MTAPKSLAPQSFWFTLLLGLFAGLPALSIDLSAPTLVALPAALGTDVTTAGLSLTLFMAGFAVGQFAGGSASDRNGRRPVLIGALTVYAISGLFCALSVSGTQLAAARLVQGAAAGACSVQALAIVQDLFQGEAARRKQSYVTVVLGIAPILAPALGALMTSVWGWRSVHLSLAIAGALLGMVVILGLAESRASAAPAPVLPGPAPSKNELWLQEGPFWRLTAINAMSYGTLFAYIAGAPIVIMGQMGYSATVYAAVFASTALALSAGAWTSALLGRRGLGSGNLTGPGLVAQAGGTLALALACTGADRCGHGVILPPLLLCCFARGVVSPNLAHLAMNCRREGAGAASAMFGFSQLAVGAAASAAVAALLPISGYGGVAGPMAILACTAAILWLTTGRGRKEDASSPRSEGAAPSTTAGRSNKG